MSISLAEALAELRRELYAAQADGAHEQFQFEVEQAELSLEVEFRRDGNGGVKVEVGAFGATAGVEAGGALGSTRRQVLTLTLQVRDQALGGERAKIRRAVGGTAAADEASPEQPPGAAASDDAVESPREGAELRPWEL
ncbi:MULTISPECIES: trypco2 family protein [unclassified Streptomyces]|uniref:trypco2 family protein n=1 Tax=unclassified Streptomyces TaxID=2593676 RepID=UPI00300934B3